MSVFRIGVIRINADHNGHVAGDYYEVWYNTDEHLGTPDEYIEVYKNSNPDTGSPEVSGGELVFGGWFFPFTYQYNHTEDGLVIPNDETSEYYFAHQSTFPYYQRYSRQRTEGSTIRTEVTDFVQPSEVGISDGEITVRAVADTGVIGLPVSFNINGGSFVNDGTNSYTFTGLGIGLYTIGAKDAFGSQSQVLFQLLAETQTTTLKYFIEWKDWDGSQLRIEIYDRDFSGTSTQITAGGSPCVIRPRAEGSYVHNIIAKSSEMHIELLSTSFGQFNEFATSDDERFLAILKKNDTEKFRGYITPSSYSDMWTGSDKYIVTVIANDRLGDLKDIPYAIETYPYKNDTTQPNYIRDKIVLVPQQGVRTIQSVISECLGKIKMNLPLRVAVNISEDTHSGNNPLVETYVDVRSYANDDNYMNCLEVLTAVLNPFGACITQWEGKWWIIRTKELSLGSIDWVQGVSTGTTDLRIEHKGQFETDMFRFMGAQQIIYDDLYKYVNLKLDFKKSEQLQSGFNTLKYQPTGFGSDQLVGIEGWNIFVPVDYESNYFDIYGVPFKWDILESGDSNNPTYGWRLTRQDSADLETQVPYIYTNGRITHNSDDRFKITFNLSVGTFTPNTELEVSPPYVSFKWQFKLGDRWVSSDGIWSDTEITNVYYVTEYGQSIQVTLEFPMDGESNTESPYEFRAYTTHFGDYDVTYTGTLNNTSRNALFALIADIATTNLGLGTRLIGRVINSSGNTRYYYFELGGGTPAADNDRLVLPDDNATTEKYWIKRYDVRFDKLNGVGVFRGTIFSNMKFEYFPDGYNAPDELILTKEINGNNKRILDETLFHWDVPPTIKSGEQLYKNWLRDVNGDPTTQWTDGVFDQPVLSLQEHYYNWISSLYGLARMKISASLFLRGAELTPISVLYADGRTFMLTGVEIDFRRGTHRGEIVEISNDEVISGAFNEGFSNGFNI